LLLQKNPIVIIENSIPDEIEVGVARFYLMEQKGMALMDPSLEKIPPRKLNSTGGGFLSSSGRLNPEISGIDDVKNGMTLNGVIINITKFGAFVNIGLPQEALIHVSEMADHFVNDPYEVVALGQQVKVTVVAVDMEKQRISLSLKTNPKVYEGKPPAKPQMEERRPINKDERYQSPSARSQAIRNLNNLFKK
jgi:predicted RNA-binding protein with RPS1 domain